MTVLVYGAVAFLVKADDLGAMMAGMPIFLQGLGVVGTAAMIWVGGGIILHGLAEHGSGHLEHALDGLAMSVGIEMPPTLAACVTWAVGAAGAGIFGLLVGGIFVPVVDRVARPALKVVQESVRPHKLP